MGASQKSHRQGAPLTHIVGRLHDSPMLMLLVSDSDKPEFESGCSALELCFSSPHTDPILLSQGDAVKLRNDSGSQVGDRGFQFPPQGDSITALRHDTQEVHWSVGKLTAAGFRVVMGG